MTTARAQARKHGHAVSAQTEQRLTETPDAAVIDPGAAQILRAGQLTSALRHVGFGVVDETGEPAQLAPVTPRVVRSRPSPPAKAAAARRQPAARGANVLSLFGQACSPVAVRRVVPDRPVLVARALAHIEPTNHDARMPHIRKYVLVGADCRSLDYSAVHERRANAAAIAP